MPKAQVVRKADKIGTLQSEPVNEIQTVSLEKMALKKLGGLDANVEGGEEVEEVHAVEEKMAIVVLTKLQKLATRTMMIGKRTMPKFIIMTSGPELMQRTAKEKTATSGTQTISMMHKPQRTVGRTT